MGNDKASLQVGAMFMDIEHMTTVHYRTKLIWYM